jgi:very-short-patch-repair endonuclease
VLAERELLERAREMRRNPTEPEVRLWRKLSNSQLDHEFRRQAVIFPSICDFFCLGKGLIVGVDGDTRDPICDSNRDDLLGRRGFAVLRFTNVEVMGSLEGVVSTIRAALQKPRDRWSGLGPVREPRTR